MFGGGQPLVPEILGQTDRVLSKTTIFNLFSLSVSAVTLGD